MTRVIILSTQSRPTANIVNLLKPLELRKSFPKNFNGWVYIYCTKAEPYLYREILSKSREYGTKYGNFVLSEDKKRTQLNGKIVARFWFDFYSEYEFYEETNSYVYWYTLEGGMTDGTDIRLDKLCLSESEVLNYGNKKPLYAWHIKKLEIFDLPKELNEFYKDLEMDQYEGINTNFNNTSIIIDYYCNLLDRAPQSWQYAYIKEY
jgi:hypothetical protein